MEEIKLLDDALKVFNLNLRENLSKKILDYILLRLLDNKQNFEKMIEMLDEKISFDDILNTYKDAINQDDLYRLPENYKEGFNYFSGYVLNPIGNILVETNNVLDVINYFVRGIVFKNTITISQTEYYEFSLSNMVLIIFVEALAKFNISRNTLMILPFEECDYDDFDEVIIIENGKVNINQKIFSNKNIIYVEDHSFDEEINKEIEVLKNNNVKYELIEDSLENVLEKIKSEKPDTAVIYTKNKDIAYNFIKLANSKNTFINASLLNSEIIDSKTNRFYYKKKIMYPSGKEINIEEYFNNYTGTNNEKKEIKENIYENKNEKENSLIEVVNPWYKRIFEKIKKIFFK